MSSAVGDPKAVLNAIDKFDKSELTHVTPKEKVVLPTAETIDQERKEKQLLDEITQPPPLKHTETAVKNPLPTKEDIAMEKSAR
ncbi:uncharacterized protein DEA37_0011495 [Paragonimus westermani]|uniref:Thymosin beta n=1 Tax=Paragonimus westermani TaxID=34504 RepID=A0A5J4NIG3_9TREM|nr:uncharacterized protein DEA37_0011495 [Paragonimus westermani]